MSLCVKYDREKYNIHRLLHISYLITISSLFHHFGTLTELCHALPIIIKGQFRKKNGLGIYFKKYTILLMPIEQREFFLRLLSKPFLRFHLRIRETNSVLH